MDNMIGRRIKDRRKELHITGTQIKEATGISTGNLSDIENGKILPSATALIGLSKILNCSCDYILFGISRISESMNEYDEQSDEHILLEQFKALSEDDKEEIMMMVQLKFSRMQRSKKNAQKSSSSGSENTTSGIA